MVSGPQPGVQSTTSSTGRSGLQPCAGAGRGRLTKQTAPKSIPDIRAIRAGLIDPPVCLDTRNAQAVTEKPNAKCILGLLRAPHNNRGCNSPKGVDATMNGRRATLFHCGVSQSHCGSHADKTLNSLTWQPAVRLRQGKNWNTPRRRIPLWCIQSGRGYLVLDVTPSALIFECLITAPHRLDSRLISAANASGVPPAATAPVTTNFSVIPGMVSATLTALFKRSTTALDTTAGAMIPPQPVTSKSGTPASTSVGSAGNEADRFSLLSASPRTRPALTCAPKDCMLSKFSFATWNTSPPSPSTDRCSGRPKPWNGLRRASNSNASPVWEYRHPLFSPTPRSRHRRSRVYCTIS